MSVVVSFVLLVSVVQFIDSFDFLWLEGYWVCEVNDWISEEVWGDMCGGLMLVINCFLCDGWVSGFEFICIQFFDQIYYCVQFGGCEVVCFEFVEQGE